MTPEAQEKRILANIEHGIACPGCGDHDCSEVPTDISKSVTPVWGCHECGQWGYQSEFKEGV